MNLDLSSFQKALSSLQRALLVADDQGFMSGLSDSQADAIRAGVIHNFELTYELCWKFIGRWLDANLGSTYVAGVARRQLFRLAAEHKLIEDVDKWMEYHEARNETSHTYDENTAESVFQTAHEFVADAESLLKALEDRNG